MAMLDQKWNKLCITSSSTNMPRLRERDYNGLRNVMRNLLCVFLLKTRINIEHYKHAREALFFFPLMPGSSSSMAELVKLVILCVLWREMKSRKISVKLYFHIWAVFFSCAFRQICSSLKHWHKIPTESDSIDSPFQFFFLSWTLRTEILRNGESPPVLKADKIVEWKRVYDKESVFCLIS